MPEALRILRDELPNIDVMIVMGVSLIASTGGVGVLRQNSMRTENSAIPSRDGCPI
jgi:hypothetical protein